jgi:two-component system response regulator PilR (NtrC family)
MGTQTASTVAPHPAPTAPAVQRVIGVVAPPEDADRYASLTTAGFQPLLVASAADLVTLALKKQLAACVVELTGNGIGGLEIVLKSLAQLRAHLPQVLRIVAVPAARRDYRLRALQFGAQELIHAPINPEELAAILKRRFSAQARRSLCDLIGSSPAMQRLYEAVLRVADSNTTIMIRGESGSGKELVARAIVALGTRRDKPFIRLNCAALPESLMESELFGHEKGAFTGAVGARAGHIEMAHGGTFFLDEIATLPISLQTKLLRVLEDHAVQRLGGSTQRQVDFRLLTATNENLEHMVRAGKFREDLYYRIHVIPITIPPLRERTGDIAVLANHFIRLHCQLNGLPPRKLDLEALAVLEEYNWPGNVRELENVIQRLVLMVEDHTIVAHHLPEQILYSSAERNESLLIPEEGIDFDAEMERIEAAYIRAALHRTGGKKTAAASLLHVNRERMKYLCRKYRVAMADESAPEGQASGE